MRLAQEGLFDPFTGESFPFWTEKQQRAGFAQSQPRVVRAWRRKLKRHQEDRRNTRSDQL